VEAGEGSACDIYLMELSPFKYSSTTLPCPIKTESFASGYINILTNFLYIFIFNHFTLSSKERDCL
jgi:hypothetical protein